MFRRHRWTLLLVVGLSLIPLRASGEETVDPKLLRFLASLAPAPAAAGKAEKPEVAENKMLCVANCGAGSVPWSVSTNCSGTCTAVDQNCDAGVRGYVECNGVKQYCQPCERCVAWTNCAGSGYFECEGWTCNSHGHIMCNIMCDGWHYWCPGHEGEELC